MPSLQTDPPNLSWGRHQPRDTERAFIRLRCILLDALTSPSLTSHPHADGPYFGNRKLCWHANIQDPTSLQNILSRYGLDALGITFIVIRIFTETRWVQRDEYPGYSHCIDADIIARDNFGEIIAETENDDVRPLGTSIQFEMQLPTVRDILPTIEWECIVGLIAHQARIVCNDYGEEVSLAVYEESLLADMNPLQSLGYTGWPGMLTTSGSIRTTSFRRIPGHT